MDSERFVDGEEYSLEEIEGHVCGPIELARQLGPEARFVYRAGRYSGYFEEVVEENPNGLVSAVEVVEAVRELRRRGLDASGIARQAGVSAETAARAMAGHGQVRRATRDAIVAAAQNGKSL